MGLGSLIRSSGGAGHIEFGPDGNLGGWGFTAWPGVINAASEISIVTQEQAEGIPGVGRGVELIAGVISQLQPELYTHQFTRNQPTIQLDTPPLLLNPDPTWHPLPTWLAAAVAAMAWHGNAFAYRGPDVADYRGYPTRLPLFDPTSVGWSGDWDRNQRYIVNTSTGQFDVEPADMLHAVVSPRAGFKMGRGILQRYQQTLKLMVVTEQAQFVLMKDGKPMGILSLGIDVTPDEAADYKKSFLAAVRESGVAAIGNAKFEPVQWNAQDLAMVPSREFNLRLASDITGVPPYLLGVPSESRVYANMETEWANFIRVTLGRYLAPLSAVLSDCFPRDKTVMFNTDQLLRADSAARWTIYKTGAEIGALLLDEIRDAEHLPPLPPRHSPEPTQAGTDTDRRNQ